MDENPEMDCQNGAATLARVFKDEEVQHGDQGVFIIPLYLWGLIYSLGAWLMQVHDKLGNFLEARLEAQGCCVLLGAAYTDSGTRMSLLVVIGVCSKRGNCAVRPINC